MKLSPSKETQWTMRGSPGISPIKETSSRYRHLQFLPVDLFTASDAGQRRPSLREVKRRKIRIAPCWPRRWLKVGTIQCQVRKRLRPAIGIVVAARCGRRDALLQMPVAQHPQEFAPLTGHQSQETIPSSPEFVRCHRPPPFHLTSQHNPFSNQTRFTRGLILCRSAVARPRPFFLRSKVPCRRRHPFGGPSARCCRRITSPSTTASVAQIRNRFSEFGTAGIPSCPGLAAGSTRSRLTHKRHFEPLWSTSVTSDCDLGGGCNQHHPKHCFDQRH
jgi:hypothetical protein